MFSEVISTIFKCYLCLVPLDVVRLRMFNNPEFGGRAFVILRGANVGSD